MGLRRCRRPRGRGLRRCRCQRRGSDATCFLSARSGDAWTRKCLGKTAAELRKAHVAAQEESALLQMSGRRLPIRYFPAHKMGWPRIECSVVDLSIRDHGLHIASGVGVDGWRVSLRLRKARVRYRRSWKTGITIPTTATSTGADIPVSSRHGRGDQGIHFFAEPAQELVDSTTTNSLPR